MKKNLLLLTFLVILSTFSYSQVWSTMGHGFDGNVNALCVFNGSLYAAGSFTHDGNGVTALNHIARWTGSAWVAVGSGLNASASALTVFNGDLYAGGDFLLAGTDSSTRIAKWNGSNWSHVGSGFNATVKCLYVWSGELYAGGSFTQSGSSSVARIAKLSGSTWQVIGSGAPGIVNAIVDYNAELFIGGGWSSPGVSRLSGGSWVSLGTGGPDFEVTSLAVFRKQTSSNLVLWIGGKFNQPSPRLCTWTASGFATSFNNYNTTASANVYALCSTAPFLYSGGGFSLTVGSNNISKLARYNGSAPWDSVGAAPDNDVTAITTLDNHLVIGGKFTMVNSTSMNHVAMRADLIGIEEPDANVISKNFFPNPFENEAILKLQTRSLLHTPSLVILDVTGRELNRVSEISSFNIVNHEIEFRIQSKGLPAGIYFYRINDKSESITSGKFIIE